MCKVVNKYKEPYDIYIGRGSIWGNPFPITATQNREKVIEKYKEHLWSQIQKGEVSLEALADLDGKRLGCFCKPKACHGDVLVEACKWAREQLSLSN